MGKDAEVDPPVFVEPFTDMTFEEKTTINITTKITGRPAPVLKWFRDDAELKPKLANKDFKEGSAIKLEATAKGRSLPEITWYRDDELLVAGGLIKITTQEIKGDVTSVLIIDKCVEANAGNFKVVAKNSTGEDSQTAAVTVTVKKEKPRFGKKPADLTKEENQEAVFETTVIGKPDATVEWFFGKVKFENGERVTIEKEENKHRLIIKQLLFT